MHVELTTDQKEETAVADVTKYITAGLQWRFTPFPGKMPALDGLIHLCKNRGQLTGDQINVQIKTGRSYLSKKEQASDIIINLHDPVAFTKWKKVWLNVPGAMLLLFADYENDYTRTPTIYWADLKDRSSYVSGDAPKIFFPRTQVLDRSFLTLYSRLIDFKSNYSYSSKLPIIQMPAYHDKVVSLSRSESLKEGGMKFYKNWRDELPSNRVSPVFGEILVNRVGWKNISRNSRRPGRVAQSWQLLPVAKEIVKTVKKATLIRGHSLFILNQADNTITFKKYYYLRAKVKFDHRGEAVVYVILRQITIEGCEDRHLANSSTWFYNVYEGERGNKKNATNSFLKKETKDNLSA